MNDDHGQEVAVRAWTTPQGKRRWPGAGGQEYDLGPSAWSLTFDTETTLDPGQGLRVGAYQLRQRHRLREEGLFYEPDALTDGELRTLREYAATEGLALKTREEFVDEVFLRAAWDRRALIIGHNLVFDLSRISIASSPCQPTDPSMRGGFSLKLSEKKHASHVQVKRINAGAAFIRLTIPSGISPEQRNRGSGGRVKNHHGYFLDTATLGGALFGGRPSLAHLARTLKTKTQKSEAGHGQTITPDYLRYAHRDVQVTWECSVGLRERYTKYDLPRGPWQIFSEAGIGKAHLEKIGLVPFQQANRWPDHVTSAVMESYHGGRTECMIRRTPVPGVYVDFKSQYPTAFTLQQLDRFLVADHVRWRDEDPAAVQRSLRDVTVDDVLRRETWTGLHALVLVAPDGDRLPTRARYTGPRRRTARKAASRSMNLAVPYRSGGPAQWYTLADCIASKLMTGKPPRVLAVLRFDAGPAQTGLGRVSIAGEAAFQVDPRHENLISRLVELRDDVRVQQRAAGRDGNAAEEARLDGAQQAMKATASSTAYGAPIELNPIEHRKRTSVNVHLPNGDSYQARVERTEKPGKWFHPLIATLVAAGGRLLLATAMRLVADQGGRYAFCDTDSLFVVATPDGRPARCEGNPSGEDSIPTLTWEQVDEIVAHFVALNPYPQGTASILEIEKENRDDQGNQREIECFAIASKRYALFSRDEDGRPKLLATAGKFKRSEHGLGHLLPPHAPSPDTTNRDWMNEWWQHLLDIELGFESQEPPWFDEPAIGRLTVTSPRDLKAFKAYNQNRSYAEQVKPWGFLCIAHPTIIERARPGGVGCLIAPFERDPERRKAMRWIDRDYPARPASTINTNTTREIRNEQITVKSYRDYFTDYREHPEAKAADPADGKPCHRWTRGLLQPRSISATELVRVGKETNRLADTDLADETDDTRVIEYPAPTRKCRGCDERVSGRRQWHSEACRKRAERRTRRSSLPDDVIV